MVSKGDLCPGRATCIVEAAAGASLVTEYCDTDPDVGCGSATESMLRIIVGSSTKAGRVGCLNWALLSLSDAVRVRPRCRQLCCSFTKR